MSDSVELGEDIWFSTWKQTMRIVTLYISDYVDEFPEFKDFVAEEPFYAAMGGWYFHKFSRPALLRLSEIIGLLADDPSTAAKRGKSKDEWVDSFVCDLNIFKDHLNKRLSHLD